MSKRKISQDAEVSSKSRLNTGSSALNNQLEVLRTSRGTPRFDDACLSVLLGISLAVGSISKGQEVLLDKIESIAQKVEDLKKEVTLMKEQQQVRVETTLHAPSWLPSDLEIQGWLSSPIPSPERISSPVITCFETLSHFDNPVIDLTSQSGGSMDLLEWESLEKLMSFSPPLM